MKDDIRKRVLYQEMVSDAQRLGDRYLQRMLASRVQKLRRGGTFSVGGANLIPFPKTFVGIGTCMQDAPSLGKVLFQSAMIPVSITLVLTALIKVTLAIYAGPGV